MGRAVETEGFYQRYGKRAIDIALSSIGLVATSPLLGATALAIKLDSPGPVLFKQKRVGKNKELFDIYKFRSMRSDTPADVPTHQLGDPSARITKVGAFIRRTSIDELPQLVNILKGDMSFVGPRPALWNQYDLIEERDRYGANDVVPGLTGWAQINGRDELEIPVKARYDGEYAADPSFAMDAKCFLGTIGSVLTSDGVVEGGTGQMAEEEQTLTEEQQDALVSPEKLEREVQIGAAVTGAATAVGIAGVAALAHHMTRGEKKHGTSKPHKSLVLPIATSAVVTGLGVCAVYDQMKKRKLEATAQTSAERAEHVEKPEESNEPVDHEASITHDLPIRVLITGANSYVGTHVEQWLAQWPDRFEVDTIDMRDPSWLEYDFSGYDTVYHVAGIAHADVGSVTDEQKAAYYAVNTDLAIECAQKAKDAGVSQFILMSSMIVYGGKDWIDASTEPAPANFYGDSKWRADEGVRALADDNFKVAVLRPPMIYGRGSKGNYPQLAKLATKLPAFPQVRNRRSMLHIENLCEFVRLIIEDRAVGVFFPQNAEHVCTSDMVREIAKVRDHHIVMVPGMSLPVDLMGKVPGKVGGLASKAFGDSAYDLALSEYPRNYRVCTFEESIRLTEMGAERLNNNGSSSRQKKVLIVAHVASMIGLFNIPSIELLQGMGYEVHVACNFEKGSTSSDESVHALRKRLSGMGVSCFQVDFDRNVFDLTQDGRAYKQLLTLLKNNKYEFVHCHSPIGGALSRIVCHETGTKCIYTAHGFHFYDGAPLKNWFLFYPIEKALSRYTDVLITINHEDYERARTKFHAKKTVYIPGVGVDLSRFRPVKLTGEKRREIGLGDDDFVMLNVGELSPRKNQPVAVEALALLPDNVHLVICGQGPDHEALVQLAESLGVANRLHLLGYRSDIAEIIAASDAFVFPSLQEGLPVAVMEAMACGLPVVASKIRGIDPDLIVDHESGLVLPETTPENIARAVKELMSDPELGKRLAATAVNSIQKFGLEDVLAQESKVYAGGGLSNADPRETRTGA